MNILVRGLPEDAQRKIRKIAERENLSFNQAVIQLIAAALEKMEKEKKEKKRSDDAFDRIRELRQELYQKYGMQEDSTKLIREDRDNR